MSTENTALAITGQHEITRLDAASMILGPAWDRIQAFGKMMARGGITVPRHLHGNEADCAAVTMQALTWGMNPFAVAQKTHVTQGGALGYESQLVNAVIQNSGELEGDPQYEHFGDWTKVLGKVEERKSDKGGKYYVATYTKADEAGLGVIVRATLRGESKPRELELLMSQAYPRFSTQWATDPKQQICYLALRKFVRLHKPGVLLGVYTDDELPAPSGEKFMGPAEVVPQSPSHYPAAEFDKNLPAWRRAIEAGKKAAEDLIAMVETKGALTDEQKATLRAIKPLHPASDVQDVQPKDEAQAFTYAQVADKLSAATNVDQLAEAGSLIGAVANADHRAELVTLYKQRSIEMETA